MSTIASRRAPRASGTRAARRCGRRAWWPALLLAALSAVPAGLPAQRGARARAQASAAAPAGDSMPTIVQRGRIDPRLEVNFSALAVPSTVYVGQQVTYQIGVFLSREVSQRLRRNPEFVPPDVRSMLAYDLPSTTRPLQREENGRVYDVHVFQRALFPLTPGAHVLAPARLTYSLPLANTFFSREETHAARTSALTVMAQDPPTLGRPDGYTGAVGRIALDARVDTPTSRVGDPVTLVVSVQGVGNVSLFPRPEVVLPWGDAVDGAERVVIDSGLVLIQGRKEFEWVVTPRREGALEVPALRYPYWNPYTERYEVALTRPLPLRVEGGTLAAPLAPSRDEVPRLTLRTRYRGAIARPMAQSPILWAFLGIIPLPALILGARRRPRHSRDTRVPAPMQAIASSAAEGASSLRRTFATAVADRTGVGAWAMADARRLVRTLRRAGVTTETANRAQVVLAEIDRATYGGESSPPPIDLARRAADTYAAIDAEAIPRGAATGRSVSRGATRVGAVLVVLASLGLAQVAIALADDAGEAREFARGVSLYHDGNLPAAMEAFREVTRAAPRAADAWANLGTAAWEARDTASAAIGWQRALRLEPTASDVRVRLETTPGFRGGLLGDVPPIPIDLAAVFGVLLWLLGWGTLAWTVHRGRADLRTVPLSAIGAAAVMGILTVALADTIAGHDHVVVTQGTPLRSAPALGAEASTDVLTGESGVEITAQGVWSRVRLSDGRSGWIESRRLASLDLSRDP